MLVDELSPIFKELVWDLLIKEAIAEILVSLSLGPTSFLGVAVTRIIIWVTNKLYPIIQKRLKVGEIRLVNEVHQKAYEKAQVKLKVVALESGINSDRFKAERKIQHEKLTKLVMYNIAD